MILRLLQVQASLAMTPRLLVLPGRVAVLAFKAARLLAVAYRALLVQVLAFLGLVLLLLASLAAALAIEASLALSLSVARRMAWFRQALVLTEPLLPSTVPQREVGPTWAMAPEGWWRG